MSRRDFRGMILPALAVLAVSLCFRPLPALAQHDADMAPEAAPALVCPGCGMEGGLCEHCTPHAEALLRQSAVDFCPDCEDPQQLCEMCSMGVAGALEVLKTMAPMYADSPEHTMACLDGTLGGDIPALYGTLMQAAMEQGLLNDSTMTGSIFPDAMVTGWSPASLMYVGINLPAGSEAAAPLHAFTVPAGRYLMFHHLGPEPGATWMAAFAWAQMAGVELGTGPAGQHDLSDGSDGNLEMMIYIPVAAMDAEAPAEGM